MDYPTEHDLRDVVAFWWFLRNCGLLNVKPISRTHYVAIDPATMAIVAGRLGDRSGFDAAWRYPDYATAKAALDVWDGADMPGGGAT
jgi:hypothetical protein